MRARNGLDDLKITPPKGGWRFGSNYTTCPKCSEDRSSRGQRKPCLSVTVDDDDHGGFVYHCNHCQWSGNIAGTGRRGGYSQRSAPPPPVRPVAPVSTPRPPKLLEYLEGKRKISHSVIEYFGVYATYYFFPQTGKKEPCICFPYFSHGQLINNKYRSPSKDFVQIKDAEQIIYNLDSVADNDSVIWAEGEIDVMSIHDAGFTSVISLPGGAPNSKKDHQQRSDADDKRFLPIAGALDTLSALKRIYIATDMDPPGEALAEEIARRVGKERCYRVRWPSGCKDANDVLVRYGRNAIASCIAESKPIPIDGLAEPDPDSLLRYRRSPQIEMVSTGWPAVDSIFRVPKDGRLFVITGIPNSGKSEFVDALLINVATNLGWHSIIFSPENMPQEIHLAKLVEKATGQPFTGSSPACLTDDQVLDAGEWLRRHVVYIRQDDVEEEMPLERILDLANRAVARYGSRFLVIDPYNQVDHKRTSGQTETEYIQKFLKRLKKWSSARGCNVILVAHPEKLRRQQDGKTPIPTGYDISGSAHWYNAADFGITVHRPSVDGPEVEIWVWKVRHKVHGKKGYAVLKWDRLSGRYSDPGAPAQHDLNLPDIDGFGL